MSDHPIDNIQWKLAEQLDANHWNPNVGHRDEMRLLEHSMLETGWLQPLLVNRDLTIIDGFHRWRLAQDSKALRARDKGMVPVAILDIDRAHAMATTVRINRARGTHVAVKMSELVHALVNEHGWTVEQVGKEIGADSDEVELLLQDGVFEVRNISSWAYSKAWYPTEEAG